MAIMRQGEKKDAELTALKLTNYWIPDSRTNELTRLRLGSGGQDRLRSDSGGQAIPQLTS